MTKLRMPASARIYDRELLLNEFGTDSPSISDRTMRFFEMWREWDHKIVVGRYNILPTRKQLKSMGMIEFFEFQIRGIEVRFASEELLAIAKLGGITDV